jgi:hypothetical protein
MIIEKIVKTLCGMKSHFKAELAKKKLTADGQALANEIASEVYRHIDNCLDALKNPNLTIQDILSTLEENLFCCIQCHSSYRNISHLLQFEDDADPSSELKFTVLPLEPNYLLSNLRCDSMYGDKLSKELRADPTREKLTKLIDAQSESSETVANNGLLEVKEAPHPPTKQSQFSFTFTVSSRRSERRISSIFRPFLVDNNDSVGGGPLSAEDAPAKEDNKKKKRFFGLCC